MSKFLAFLLVIFISSHSFGAKESKGERFVFPLEIKVMLSSPQYMKTFNNVRRGLKKQNKGLLVSGASVESIGEKTYVYVQLESVDLLRLPAIKKYIGEVVGVVDHGNSEGDPKIESTYFKPVTEPPGPPPRS